MLSLIYSLKDVEYFVSIMFCCSKAVHLLLDKGAGIECKNNDGETALHVMARRRRLGCVIALLSSGANVNATSNDGSTPLHIAAKVRLVN